MVEFALLGTIGLEKSQIRLYHKSIGYGEGVAAGDCTLGILVVSFE